MKIAVIGGIGAGKSEVLGAAREMGITCLSADEINAELLKDPDYIAELEKRFPDCVVCGVGDKTRVSARVYSGNNSSLELNAREHRRIQRRNEE